MAKSQKSMKLGALRRRGWTDGLIASLLPEPRVFYGHGRPFRVWRTSDVLAAEQTAEFIANHAEITPSDLLRRPTRGDCRSARRLFEESWSRAEKDGSAPWILAGLYHSAILVRLSSAVSDPTSSQVSSWTGEFLALERTGSPRHISEALRGLTRSALWLDSHRGEPVCDRVIDRYPHVLRAISESSIADLGSLQSEENIMNMLTSPDFPLGMLFKDGLSKVWSVWYVPRAIRTAPTPARPTPALPGSCSPPPAYIWPRCGFWPWRPRRHFLTPVWTAPSPPARRRTAAPATPTWPPRRRSLT